MLKMQAQEYLIDFAGTGESTTVDSVQVKNLTQFTELTLNGTDVLHLMGVVGIGKTVAQNSPALRIYPNPMNESSFIEFDAVASGIAIIEIFDVAGNKVVQAHNMLPCGRHTFVASGLSSGIHTLSIKSAESVYSGKIVCASAVTGNGKINYVTTRPKTAVPGNLKITNSQVPMQYNDGDQLLFKCFSGIYATVIALVPTQSQTVTANFVACTDADNNNYATVTIGTQTWMAENLNVGLRINGTMNQTNNGIIEKYCYDNDETNCAIYGGLYQWNEAMQYSTVYEAQGICPVGWHIPSPWYGEWGILNNFLGGKSVAGGKLKSTGTIQAGTGLWDNPNNATNESGFTALPGGYRWQNYLFYEMSRIGLWWTSSYKDTQESYAMFMACDSSSVSETFARRWHGFSVRCVKDN
jgi:uncharacterized protein (TIGR02145 family)